MFPTDYTVQTRAKAQSVELGQYYSVLFGTNFHNSIIFGPTDLRLCMEVHINHEKKT